MPAPLAAVLLLAAGSAPFVTVSATYMPPVKGSEATVAVQFTPTDPNIRVNEDPAPRLKLGPEQQILAEKPRPEAGKARPAPGETRYLDTAVPVVFPVLVKPGAAAGVHALKASVTYFYCSKSEGWCRKGTSDVSLDVRVP
jgi:hypothetical protein